MVDDARQEIEGGGDVVDDGSSSHDRIIEFSAQRIAALYDAATMCPERGCAFWPGHDNGNGKHACVTPDGTMYHWSSKP